MNASSPPGTSVGVATGLIVGGTVGTAVGVGVAVGVGDVQPARKIAAMIEAAMRMIVVLLAVIVPLSYRSRIRY